MGGGSFSGAGETDAEREDAERFVRQRRAKIDRERHAANRRKDAVSRKRNIAETRRGKPKKAKWVQT